MRDYSHGKVRAEKFKDLGNFKYQVRGKLYGLRFDDDFIVTDSDLRAVIHLDSRSAAIALIQERM